MIYRKFKPAPQLQPFVECYFVWHSGAQKVENLILESPPHGFCSIVFNSGDSYFLQNKKYERLEVPREFISGQSIYSYKLFLDGHINITGIVLKPTALASIFQLPVFEYMEERISLSQVLSPLLINSTASHISSATDENEKVRIAERFMLDALAKITPEQDAVDEAANLIVEKNGMVDVTELISNAFMSRRNFERKFFKKVGLSPKYYARVRRVSHLMNLIAGKKKVDWASVFTECEYYDQSHFIKDFLEFTGRTPQQYLKENTELANYIEKPRPSDIV